MLPSFAFLKFADELCAYGLLALALADCFANGNWDRYSLLWAIMAVMAFYAFYSLTLPYNTPAAIAKDWLIQLKPFIPFAVILTIRPSMTETDKRIARITAIVTVAVTAILMIAGNHVVRKLIVHITYCGISCFVSAMIYLFCSIDRKGEITRTDMFAAIAMLTIGLGCTRAKYYGIFVLALYFLLFYKPGIFKRLSTMSILTVAAVGALVMAVSWHKIQYYFLSGEGTDFDISVIESYARPVMYATGVLVIADRLLLGSGLASFGSYVSGESYSALYHEYGIDKVYGLSESMHEFICDAFYPSLAQFGLIGIMLFAAFWIYIYRLLLHMLRSDPQLGRYYYIIGVITICFIGIESIASTTLVQSPGMVLMMLLAFICAKSACLFGVPSLPKPIDKIRKLKIIT